MNSEDRKYITFALPLIKQLYLEPTKAIQQIKLFAINAKAMRSDCAVDDVVKEVICDATLGCDKMSKYIYDMLAKHKPLEDWEDGDWEGPQLFKDGQIDLSQVEEEANYVRSILQEGKFIDDAYLFARRRRAADDMSMGMPKWQDWDLIEPFNSLYEGQVPVSISIERLINWNIETEYDRVKLAVYLAIRSLAKDGVAITTQQAIKWRSMGCKNGQEFKQALNDKKLQAIVDKWHTRYYFQKILADLEDSKLIIALPRQRHTFVSASILDEDAFIEACVDKIRRITTKAKEKRMAAERKHMNDKLTEMLKKGLDGIKDVTPEKIEPKKKEQYIEKEGKTPYEKQLQDRRWKAFRKFVFAVRGNKCEICGGTHVLQVHHPKYISGRRAWEYTCNEVQVLCHDCHEKVHNLKS